MKNDALVVVRLVMDLILQNRLQIVKEIWLLCAFSKEDLQTICGENVDVFNPELLKRVFHKLNNYIVRGKTENEFKAFFDKKRNIFRIPITTKKSKKLSSLEKRFANLLLEIQMELLKSNIFINIEANKVITNFEIDFLVNGNVGFEVNGLFPHSSKSNNLRWINNQHYEKMISLCDRQVFQYTFYETDFKNIERLKNNIKQILSNHLFVNDNDNALKFKKLKYEDAIELSRNTFLTDDSKFAIYKTGKHYQIIDNKEIIGFLVKTNILSGSNNYKNAYQIYLNRFDNNINAQVLQFCKNNNIHLVIDNDKQNWFLHIPHLNIDYVSQLFEFSTSGKRRLTFDEKRYYERQFKKLVKGIRQLVMPEKRHLIKTCGISVILPK